MGFYNPNRFHKLVLFVAQFSFFCGVQMLFSIFSGVTPKWKCGESGNFTNDCAVYSMCPRESLALSDAPFYSVVTEFERFCDGDKKDTFLKNYGTAIFVGVFFGTILFGRLSDMFGRRPIGIFVYGSVVLLNFASGFLNSTLLILVGRFLVGLAIGGCIVVVTAYCNELLLPHQRIMIRVYFNWGVARVSLTAVCFIFPHWRYATMACSILLVPAFLVLIFALPESPIWLHNKDNEAALRNSELKIAKIAGRNHVPIVHPDKIHPKVRQYLRQTIFQGFVELLKTPSIRQKLLVLWCMWFVSSLCSYANDLQSGTLVGNLYVNQFLFGSILVVSKWCLGYADRNCPNFSRRRLHQCSQVATCCIFLCMLTLVLFGYKGFILTALNLVGVVCIELTWDANQLCAVEAFPTVWRGSALGSCSLVARIGALIAPQLAFYVLIWPPLIYLIVTIIGAVNFFVALKWMPETKV